MGIYGGNPSQALGDESPDDPAVPHVYGEALDEHVNKMVLDINEKANKAFLNFIQNIPEDTPEVNRKKMIAAAKENINNRAEAVLKIQLSEGILQVGGAVMNVDP